MDFAQPQKCQTRRLCYKENITFSSKSKYSISKAEHRQGGGNMVAAKAEP